MTGGRRLPFKEVIMLNKCCCRRRSPSASRQGGAAVEFAIVLPVLMTLALGAVDFGRIYTTSISLRNATRIGAEQGATHRLTPLTQSAWENRIRTAVLQEMQSVPQFDSTQLSLTIGSRTTATGQLVIDLSTSYPFHTVVAWPGTSPTVLLGARVSMEQYR